MSKIKNGGLDQYVAEPFEQQQFGAAGAEGVKSGSYYLSGLQLVSLAIVWRQYRVLKAVLSAGLLLDGIVRGRFSQNISVWVYVWGFRFGCWEETGGV